MSRFVMLLVLALLAGACSELALTDVGERSSGWIAGQPETSEVLPLSEEETPSDLVPSADVRWWNDGLSKSSNASIPSLERISSRRNPGDRFAQASRSEIAAFFPDLSFPARVPAEVRSVTSQLVLAPSEPSLGGGHIASFGLWTSDPYTQSRTVGQLATISVFAGRSDDPCGVAGDACATEQVADRLVGRIARSTGETILWSDADLTYEMFVRKPAMAAVPAMLESITPISTLVETPEADPGLVEQTDASPQPATVP